MPLLSIIVPVYNAEKYLEKCLDSIINQTFRDYETILIDDGSTDRSGIICDEYAVKDARFKVIHQKNSGVSSARNTGLDIAQGKYLGFIDSDDVIKNDMFEKMIKVIEENKCDFVICGFDYIDYTGNTIRDIGNKNHMDRLLDKADLLQMAFALNQKVFYGSVWNKLFKADIVKKIKFDETISLFEDWFWMINVYTSSSSARVLKEVCYHYSTDETNSQSKTKNGNIIYNSLYKETRIVRLIDGSNSIRSIAQIRFLDDASSYLGRISPISMSSFKIKMLMIKEIIRGRKEKLITKTQRNKYLIEGVIRK